MKFTDDTNVSITLKDNISLEAQKKGQNPPDLEGLNHFYRILDSGAVQWQAKHVIVEIEEKMFNRGAKIIGDNVKMYGFCMIYIWDNVEYDPDNPKATQPDVIFKYNLPTRFDTEPESITTTNRVVDGNAIKVYQLHYSRDNLFMSNVEILMDRSNSVDFVGIIFDNIIPSNIRTFGNFPFLFTENARLNGINYQLDATRFDMLESILTRSKSNPEIPYRLNKSGGLIGAKITDLPALVSTFGGESFRDPINSSTTAILRSRRGIKEISQSPIESTLLF